MDAASFHLRIEAVKKHEKTREKLICGLRKDDKTRGSRIRGLRKCGKTRGSLIGAVKGDVNLLCILRVAMLGTAKYT